MAASGLDCKNIQKPNHWIPHTGKCPELVLTTENFEVGVQNKVNCFIVIENNNDTYDNNFF